MLAQFPFLERDVQYKEIKGGIYQPGCNPPTPNFLGAVVEYQRGEQNLQSFCSECNSSH